MKALLIALLFFLPFLSSAKDKKILFIAGGVTHGPGDHEFRAGCLLLQKCLENTSGIQVEVHFDGWPKSDRAFKGVDAVIIYADGGDVHPAIQGNRTQLIQELEKKGVGIMCVHYGLGVPPGTHGKNMQDWIGGHYEHAYSANPMWSPLFNTLPKHSITKGVKPFRVRDEWYFNIRFRENTVGLITPILEATPSDDVRDGPYVWPKGPFKHIIDKNGRSETLMWTYDRPNGGRSVGFTGGHKHMNWGNDNFRKLILNAVLWIAKEPIPKGGVESHVTEEQLLENWDIKDDK